MTTHWLDALTASVAPRWTLQRQRARMAAELIARYYDAASPGRRTEGWRRVSGDGNAATERGRPTRETVRDLLRNNGWARSGVNAIVDHVIGWGITPKLPPGRFGAAWRQWANTTACDADGRRTLNGLAKLALRTWATSGECLIRRRVRRIEDGLPIPLQLQVLEPDYLDDAKDTALPNGGQIIQGIEYDALGAPAAYWLFRQHPGAERVSRTATVGGSFRIPASEILHLADPDRPGQARDVSLFVPILLRLKDLDDYEDAALMKQKIAACLAVILTDSTGTGAPLGTADDTLLPGVDSLQPGLIARFAAGDEAKVVQPPSVSEHTPYTKGVLGGIAAGLGISYESLTGDFSEVNFSSARMSRLREWDRIHHWRWDMLVPQFYGPHAQGRSVWDWAVQVGAVVGLSVPAGFVPEWTAPPMPMIEPDKEGLAYQRNIRSGIQTMSDALRELGYDPETFFQEYAEDLKRLDRLGIILDSDPRTTTQAGQLQGKAAAESAPREPAAPRVSADAERADRLEAAVLRLAAQTNGHAERPWIEKGAFHIETPITVEPAAAPPVTVDARTTVEAGAIAPVLHPPPPAAVTVDARTTVEPGAIVLPPSPPVTVDARTSIAEGAFHVETPVTVTPPPQQSVTVFRSTPRPAPPDEPEDPESPDGA